MPVRVQYRAVSPAISGQRWYQQDHCIRVCTVASGLHGFRARRALRGIRRNRITGLLHTLYGRVALLKTNATDLRLTYSATAQELLGKGAALRCGCSEAVVRAFTSGAPNRRAGIGSAP